MVQLLRLVPYKYWFISSSQKLLGVYCFCFNFKRKKLRQAAYLMTWLLVKPAGLSCPYCCSNVTDIIEHTKLLKGHKGQVEFHLFSRV